MINPFDGINQHCNSQMQGGYEDVRSRLPKEVCGWAGSPGYTNMSPMPALREQAGAPIWMNSRGEMPGASSVGEITMANNGTTWAHQNLPYMNNALSTQIGKYVTVDFILSSGQTTEKRGVLVGVGYNYIVIREDDTNAYLICDFYAIQFVRIGN